MSNNKKTYEERAAAAPTELHVRFAAWLEEKTGQKVDLKTVQLACAMRMDFQSSPENQTALQAKKADAAAKAEKRKADKLAKLKAELAKLEAETATSMPAEKPAQARKATAPKAADSPVKASTRTRKATAAKVTEKAPTQPRAARTRRTVAAKKTA